MNVFKVLREEVDALHAAVNREHEKLSDATGELGDTTGQWAETTHDNAIYSIQMDIVRTQSGRLRQILDDVNKIQIVEWQPQSNCVTLGSLVRVVVTSIGGMMVKIGWYGSQYMSDAKKGPHGYQRISYLSALGSALLGKKPGDEFSYKVWDTSPREMKGKIEEVG